jgi:hypothetical protein
MFTTPTTSTTTNDKGTVTGTTNNKGPNNVNSDDYRETKPTHNASKKAQDMSNLNDVSSATSICKFFFFSFHYFVTYNYF